MSSISKNVQPNNLLSNKTKKIAKNMRIVTVHSGGG